MKPKRRIVILHPHFTLPGGAGNVALEQAEVLSEQYDVVMLCITAAGRFRRMAPDVRFVELGGALTGSLRHWLGWPLFLRKIRASIAALQPDVIFPHVFPANWWAWNIKKRFPEIPCVWYCHEPSAFVHYDGYVRNVPFLWRCILKATAYYTKRYDAHATAGCCDYLITNSEHTSKEIKRIYHRSPDIIIPPVIKHVFSCADGYIPTSRLIMASRLNRVKNIEIAIRAMALLPQEYTLDIAGEGELHRELQRVAEQSGMANRVNFLGEKNSGELADLYRHSCWFLALSENESFGIAAAEALGCGTPVIAAGKGALAGMIRHGINGILLPELSPKSVAEAIANIGNASEEYLDMRSNAAVSVVHYRKERHAASLLGFMDSILTYPAA